MGLIIESEEPNGVYIEARRESFIVSSSRTSDYVELDYDELPALKNILNTVELMERYGEWRKKTARTQEQADAFAQSAE